MFLDPQVWADTTNGNKKCYKCNKAGGIMSNCIRCTSASHCTQCGSNFLDSTFKGCITACSLDTNSKLYNYHYFYVNLY